MSTGERRPLADAQREAVEFMDLFRDCYEVWVVAGSVRRLKPEVGDVEHVVVPKFERQSGGIFAGDTTGVNMLTRRRDDLLRLGKITKADYNGKTRWGSLYFGCWFKGFKHEVFCADHDNFGSLLLIRTGPAEFSERYVTRMRDRGWRHRDGYVIKPVRTEADAFLCSADDPLPPPELRT